MCIEVKKEVMEEEQHEYETALFEVRQLNETRVFRLFFKLFRLRLGLRKSEIETGGDLFNSVPESDASVATDGDVRFQHILSHHRCRRG